jgi:predicted SnoaL-like aldol condensation-catalyzing enzyme
MSTSEENKAVARRWNEEGFNKHRVELMDECFHPNYTQHAGTEGPWSITVQGRDAAKAAFEEGFREYPMARVNIDDIFAEGDRVALRVTLFNEEKPMGYGSIVYRFVDGKILDDWFCWTMFGS